MSKTPKDTKAAPTPPAAPVAPDPTGTVHKFKPQPDITAAELADIVKLVVNVKLDDDHFNKLSVEAQRHFKVKE